MYVILSGAKNLLWLLRCAQSYIPGRCAFGKESIP